MRKKLKAGMVSATVGALAIALLSPMSPAHADLAPTPTDAVGVGSDTVQYLVDFLADGDASGDTGYNAAKPTNRLVSFDATPDANARAGYLNGSTNAALTPLNPTVVLRAGKHPVQRPNGSGAGIAALLADTAATPQINFVRASRLPSPAEQSTAGTNGWGFLHVVQLGTENLQLAAANSTNAPAGISAQELVSIYCNVAGHITTWNQLPGNSAGSTDAIVPLIPQAGSGTRSSFLADLQAANGGTACTTASNVVTVEENDPLSITTPAPGTSSLDTIAPFSGSRLNLYNSNYFRNPATVFPGGTTALPANIKMLTGATGDVNGFYNDTRGLYVIYRDSDKTSTKLFQPGGTANLVNTLFGTSGYFASAAGQSLIGAAGATPGYADLGNVHS